MAKNSPTAAQQTWFDQTPDDAFIRLPQLVGKPGDIHSPRLLPVSRATLWRMVQDGRFPRPHKLGPNLNAWHCGTVRDYLKGQAAAAAATAKA